METQFLSSMVFVIWPWDINSDKSHFQNLCGGRRKACRAELGIHGKQYYSKDEEVVEDCTSRV